MSEIDVGLNVYSIVVTLLFVFSIASRFIFEGPSEEEYDTELDPELLQRLRSLKKTSMRQIFWVSLGIVLIWLGVGFLPWWLQQKDWPWKLEWGLENAAAFGDSFGFINSLMSTLALVGVVAAIWLQKQELQEQRKELIITQFQLKKSADAQRDSQKELKRQANTSLNTALLSTLQGMQDSAAIEIKSDANDVEAQYALAMIKGMRLDVLDRIIGESPDKELAGSVTTGIEQWLDFALILRDCRIISDSASEIRKVDWRTALDRKDPEYIEADKDYDLDELSNFLRRLEETWPRLRRALIRTNLDPVVFDYWLQTAKLNLENKDGDTFARQLTALIEACTDASDETKHAMKVTIG